VHKSNIAKREAQGNANLKSSQLCAGVKSINTSNVFTGGTTHETLVAFLVTAIGLSCGVAFSADDVTLASVPAVVVKTVPEAGAGDVDPKLKEIKVTFSKEMKDGTWSWTTLSKESFPKADGKPKYLDDKRTCVLPVKLEPDKTYAIWVNSAKFGNFKDAAGKSAVPYLLVFKTKK
jgi:RNA polymerase sigma-70 factor (ECF subfamily)